MFKSLKQNFAPLLFAAIGIGLLTFPIWSHFRQEKELTIIKEEVSKMNLSRDDFLVGASTLFAQNASVQLNLEVLGTYASVSGNLSFSGEIMPDGSTCGANEILKRTGANNWDCAADETGGGVSFGTDNQIPFTNSAADDFDYSANLTFDGSLLDITGTASVSSDFEVGGTASSSFFNGSAFGGIDCNNAGDQLLWSGGLFTCETLADADIPDDITISSAGSVDSTALTDGGTIGFDWVDAEIADVITINGGTIGSNTISAASIWTTAGQLTVGDGGDRIDFSTSGWDIVDSVMTGMTISTNNVTGTWTTTGALTIGDGGDTFTINSSNWDVSSVGVFSGLTGLTSTGVIDFGGADSFKLPNAASPTVNATGEIAFHTGSRSLDHFDGSNTIVKLPETCFTYYIESPTASNPLSIGHKRFLNPFIITEVSSVASGSNAAGWNLQYGAPGSPTTNVFTLAKSASTSDSPRYTSFANSTIGDNNVLDVRITSASATIESFSVDICGRYTH